MAEIRLATEGDLSKVEALIGMLAGEVPDLEVQTLELGDGSALVVVVEEAEGIVGCLVGRRVPPVGHPTSVVIDSVFVLPGYRSQSLGHKMVWRFSEWAIELNCPEAHVEAPISAPRAQEFLQNCGFNVRSVGRVQTVEAGLERNNVNDEEPWYSVRCHFALKDSERFDYEERITMWRANSAAVAMERAEDEARSYAGVCGHRYLNACTSYHLADTGFAVDGKEIWSEMRQSELEPDAYLDRYFFSGQENSHSK